MNKFETLILELNKATESGSLDWKPSLKNETFQVSFSDISLTISQIDSDAPFEKDYIISMINDEGITVDSFTDIELNQSSTSMDINWYRECSSLYEKARRTALGSEKALTSILDQLRKINH